MGFETGILLKAIDGLLEIAGGIILIFMKPETVNHIIVALTQHELVANPDKAWACYLVRFGQAYTTSMQHFGVLYLLSHGIAKLVIIYLLYKKKLWSYPLSIVFLFIFIFYQMERYFHSHSIWLLIFTFLDILLIGLTWSEYRRLQRAGFSEL